MFPYYCFQFPTGFKFRGVCLPKMNNSAVEKLGNPRAIFLTIVGLTSHEDKWPRMNSCWTDFWWQVAENSYKVVKISEWVIRIRMYRTYVYNFKFYILLILVQKVVTTQNEQLVSRTFHLLHKNLCNHLLKKKRCSSKWVSPTPETLDIWRV